MKIDSERLKRWRLEKHWSQERPSISTATMIRYMVNIGRVAQAGLTRLLLSVGKKIQREIRQMARIIPGYFVYHPFLQLVVRVAMR